MLISLWQVNDSLPSNDEKLSAVAGMALSPRVEYYPSSQIKTVVAEAVDVAQQHNCPIIFSNRFSVDNHGKSIAEYSRDLALRLCHSLNIIVPNNPRDRIYRNTRTEALFALCELDKMGKVGETKVLMIVDNSIHMRRTLATFRQLIGDSTDVRLYWKSVDGEYGFGYAQKRFLHPYIFLTYEYLAYAVLLWKGWI